MPTYLSLANTLLSLRGAIRITDENDDLAYEAKGEFALLSPTWRICQGETVLASVRRRMLAWRQTWEITGSLGDFLIKRKLLSFTRSLYVVGGPYDGAEVSGNIFDLRFGIEAADGTLLARAAGKILTLRDRHNVELVSQNPPDILFSVIAMVVLQLSRKRDESKESD